MKKVEQSEFYKHISHKGTKSVSKGGTFPITTIYKNENDLVVGKLICLSWLKAEYYIQ